MLALHDLQASFRRAVLSTGDPPADLIAALADDPYAQERFEIHRNNVVSSLTAVLRETFPVVCRLVDERFFAYAAYEFLRMHPPARPALSEYGAAFPPFLQEFAPCRELVYLPDVARLEWVLNLAAAAPAYETLTATALAAHASCSAEMLRFHLRALYVQSRWPIDRILAANRPGAEDDSIDLASGGVFLEIYRANGTVFLRLLDRSRFAFRQALGMGVPLGAALELALAADAAFAHGEALAELFHDGIVTAIACQTSDGEPCK